MSTPRVGIIGLGLMGTAFAECLHDAGFTLVGFDVDKNALSNAEAHGVEPDTSPRAVADHADVVITSLPTPAIVKKAYQGPDGILKTETETVAIETSTIDAGTAERITETAGDIVTVLDVPVSAGPDQCREGDAVVIASGDRETFDREAVQSALETLGAEVHYTGDAGTASTLKLINNAMSFGNLVLAMEMVSMGAAAGLDGETMWEVLQHSGGTSKMFRRRMLEVLDRNFEPRATLETGSKDMGLVHETARDIGVPLFTASLFEELCAEACARGYGGEDIGAIVKVFEQKMGATVEPPSDK